ncbi:TonB-dependent receptor domain-containing protein [Rhizobium sp.]
MRLHVAFAAMLMSGTTLAMVMSVPAMAQEEETIVLDDDAGSDSTAPSENASDTEAAASDDSSDDAAPTQPGETRLKRIIIGSDSATPADIVNKPAAVSVIDTETVRERMSGSLDDAIRMTPGAYTRQAVEQQGITVNIRGMQGMGRVNQMIDGVPQTFRNLSGHSGTFDNMLYLEPGLLAGVDITRGAAPGADGMGTLSGAANFRTLGIDDVLMPGKTYGLVNTLQAGTNGYDFSRSTAAGWKTNIGIDGSFSVVGALSGTNKSNFKNGDGEWYPFDASADPKGGLFKVNYAPNAEHSIELGGVFFSNAFRVESASYDWQIENKTYTLKYAYQPGDNLIDFKLNAYANITDIKMAAYEGGNASEFDGRNGTNTGLGLDVSNTSTFDLNDSMSLKFFYGGGINSDEYKGNEKRGANADGELIKSGAFNDTTLTWGIVGLTAGMRYDYWTIQGEGCEVPKGQTSCNTDPRKMTRDGGDWNPKLGVTVDPMPWMQLYATYARTMRPPTVSEMFYPGGHNFDGTLAPIENNPSLQPERQQSIDIGVNLRGDGLITADDQAYLKAGYFKNRIQNYITYATDMSDPSVPYTRWVNLPGTTNMEGVEVEGGYDAGVVYGRLSLTVAETKQPLPESAGVGNDIGQLPDDYATLDAGMRFFEQRLTLGGRVRYTGESFQAYINEENSVKRPSYTLVDFYGSFKVSDNAKVFFTLDNAFDKPYFVAGSGSASLQDVSNGIGRRFIVGLTTRF